MLRPGCKLPKPQSRITRLSAAHRPTIYRPLLCAAHTQADLAQQLTAEPPVRCTFVIQHSVPFGHTVQVVGGTPALGDWEPSSALQLVWNDDNVWKCDVDLPPGTYNFKCVVSTGERLVFWESGSDRSVEVPNGAASVQVCCSWANTLDTLVIADAPAVSHQQQAEGGTATPVTAAAEAGVDTPAKEAGLSLDPDPLTHLIGAEGSSNSAAEPEAAQLQVASGEEHAAGQAASNGVAAAAAEQEPNSGEGNGNGTAEPEAAQLEVTSEEEHPTAQAASNGVAAAAAEQELNSGEGNGAAESEAAELEAGSEERHAAAAAAEQEPDEPLVGPSDTAAQYSAQSAQADALEAASDQEQLEAQAQQADPLAEAPDAPEAALELPPAEGPENATSTPEALLSEAAEEAAAVAAAADAVADAAEAVAVAIGNLVGAPLEQQPQDQERGQPGDERAAAAAASPVDLASEGEALVSNDKVAEAVPAAAAAGLGGSAVHVSAASGVEAIGLSAPEAASAAPAAQEPPAVIETAEPAAGLASDSQQDLLPDLDVAAVAVQQQVTATANEAAVPAAADVPAAQVPSLDGEAPATEITSTAGTEAAPAAVQEPELHPAAPAVTEVGSARATAAAALQEPEQDQGRRPEEQQAALAAAVGSPSTDEAGGLEAVTLGRPEVQPEPVTAAAPHCAAAPAVEAFPPSTAPGAPASSSTTDEVAEGAAGATAFANETQQQEVQPPAEQQQQLVVLEGVPRTPLVGAVAQGASGEKPVESTAQAAAEVATAAPPAAIVADPAAAVATTVAATAPDPAGAVVQEAQPAEEAVEAASEVADSIAAVAAAGAPQDAAGAGLPRASDVSVIPPGVLDVLVVQPPDDTAAVAGEAAQLPTAAAEAREEAFAAAFATPPAEAVEAAAAAVEPVIAATESEAVSVAATRVPETDVATAAAASAKSREPWLWLLSEEAETEQVPAALDRAFLEPPAEAPRDEQAAVAQLAAEGEDLQLSREQEQQARQDAYSTALVVAAAGFAQATVSEPETDVSDSDEAAVAAAAAALSREAERKALNNAWALTAPAQEVGAQAAASGPDSDNVAVLGAASAAVGLEPAAVEVSAAAISSAAVAPGTEAVVTQPVPEPLQAVLEQALPPVAPTASVDPASVVDPAPEAAQQPSELKEQAVVVPGAEPVAELAKPQPIAAAQRQDTDSPISAAVTALQTGLGRAVPSNAEEVLLPLHGPVAAGAISSASSVESDAALPLAAQEEERFDSASSISGSGVTSRSASTDSVGEELAAAAAGKAASTLEATTASMGIAGSKPDGGAPVAGTTPPVSVIDTNLDEPLLGGGSGGGAAAGPASARGQPPECDQLLDAWDAAWQKGPVAIPPLEPAGASASGSSPGGTSITGKRARDGPTPTATPIAMAAGGSGQAPAAGAAAPMYGATPSASALAVPNSLKANGRLGSGSSAAQGQAGADGGGGGSLFDRAERAAGTAPPPLSGGAAELDSPDLTMRMGGLAAMGLDRQGSASYEMRPSMLQQSLMDASAASSAPGSASQASASQGSTFLQQIRAANAAAAAANAAPTRSPTALPSAPAPVPPGGQQPSAIDIAAGIVTPKPAGLAAAAEALDDEEEERGGGTDIAGANSAGAAATAASSADAAVEKRAAEVEAMLRSGLPLTPIMWGPIARGGKAGLKGGLLSANLDSPEDDSESEDGAGAVDAKAGGVKRGGGPGGVLSGFAAFRALQQAKAAQQQQAQAQPPPDPAAAAKAALAGAAAAWDMTRSALQGAKNGLDGLTDGAAKLQAILQNNSAPVPPNIQLPGLPGLPGSPQQPTPADPAAEGPAAEEAAESSDAAANGAAANGAAANGAAANGSASANGAANGQQGPLSPQQLAALASTVANGLGAAGSTLSTHLKDLASASAALAAPPAAEPKADESPSVQNDTAARSPGGSFLNGLFGAAGRAATGLVSPAAVAPAPPEAPPADAEPEAPTAVRHFRLVAGAHMIPHVDKVDKGGEDAYFICTTGLGGVGVADGVSGWADEGIDPAEYPRTLMRFAISAYEEAKGQVAATDIIRYAQYRTSLKGSSTVCLALMKPGNLLEVANVGDSGVRIIRDGKVIFGTESQQHAFNMPYQLSHPSNVEDPDSADDADVQLIEVQEGDLIMLATDGLFDNVFDEEVEQVIAHQVRELSAQGRKLVPAPSTSAQQGAQQGRAAQPQAGGRGGGGGGRGVGLLSQSLLASAASALAGITGGSSQPMRPEDAARIARALAERAHLHARNPTQRTPWSVSSSQQPNFMWAKFFAKGGGKMDDCTVLVAIVSATGSP